MYHLKNYGDTAPQITPPSNAGHNDYGDTTPQITLPSNAGHNDKASRNLTLLLLQIC